MLTFGTSFWGNYKVSLQNLRLEAIIEILKSPLNGQTGIKEVYFFTKKGNCIDFFPSLSFNAHHCLLSSFGGADLLKRSRVLTCPPEPICCASAGIKSCLTPLPQRRRIFRPSPGTKNFLAQHGSLPEKKISHFEVPWYLFSPKGNVWFQGNDRLQKFMPHLKLAIYELTRNESDGIGPRGTPTRRGSSLQQQWNRCAMEVWSTLRLSLGFYRPSLPTKNFNGCSQIPDMLEGFLPFVCLSELRRCITGKSFCWYNREMLRLLHSPVDCCVP